jgi:putative ABC transport system permease protein
LGSLFEQVDPSGKAKNFQDEARQITLALRDLPEVEGVSTIRMSPFQVGAWNGPVAYKGRGADVRFNEGDDELDEVMGLNVVRGHWFVPADEALAYDPIVINQRLADQLFGKDDPIGKPLDPQKMRDPNQQTRTQRVVGVITDFRQHGELHEPYNYLFQRRSNRGSSDVVATTNLLVKLRPGTPASFEEKLMMRMRSVARDRTFHIEPLARARRSHMRWVLIPMAAAAIVAGFLMLMVAFGMIGVLWQNVSRRTKEIGLRRAVGGTVSDVHKQVLGELMVVATVGILAGVAIVAQAPLLAIVDWMTPGIFTAALVLTLVILYGLTVVSGLYPSRLATKVQPASALHYE